MTEEPVYSGSLLLLFVLLYHAPCAGHWSLLKRTTCRALQVARFSTSRQGTPRVARESGIFSLGLTGLRFYPASVRIQVFCDLKGHPIRVAFRAFLIQSSDPAFCRAMNPGNIFLEVPSGTMFMLKKFTPAGRGTLKKFFQKYFPEPLRRFSGRERPPMPIPEERAAAPCSLQNVSVPYEYQKGSEGNV